MLQILFDIIFHRRSFQISNGTSTIWQDECVVRSWQKNVIINTEIYVLWCRVDQCYISLQKFKCWCTDAASIIHHQSLLSDSLISCTLHRYLLRLFWSWEHLALACHLYWIFLCICVTHNISNLIMTTLSLLLVAISLLSNSSRLTDLLTILYWRWVFAAIIILSSAWIRRMIENHLNLTRLMNSLIYSIVLRSYRNQALRDECAFVLCDTKCLIMIVVFELTTLIKMCFCCIDYVMTASINLLKKKLSDRMALDSEDDDTTKYLSSSQSLQDAEQRNSVAKYIAHSQSSLEQADNNVYYISHS